MSTATGADARWTDLPPDLLRAVSGRLHDAVDFVRFHAVCKPWRNMLPSPTSHDHPPILPWLLAPGTPWRASTSHIRSIFSKTTWHRSSSGERWLASADGTGTWLLTDCGSDSPCLVHPLTGAATSLPRFPDETSKHIDEFVDGMVCADGTILVYAVRYYYKHTSYIRAAILRPGDAAWAELETELLYCNGFDECCSAAYHHGKTVLVDLYQLRVVKLRVAGGGDNGAAVDILATRFLPDEPVSPGSALLSTHILESRGELLSACVLVNKKADVDVSEGRQRAGGLTGSLSVSLYALGLGADGEEHRWLRMDSRVGLGDRALFLGCPTSLAVDAARFDGEVSGGCAYFVVNSRVAGWSTVPESCGVYKYSFGDGKATLVEELPPGWEKNTPMTWFVPQLPSMATGEK